MGCWGEGSKELGRNVRGRSPEHLALPHSVAHSLLTNSFAQFFMQLRIVLSLACWFMHTITWLDNFNQSSDHSRAGHVPYPIEFQENNTALVLRTIIYIFALEHNRAACKARGATQTRGLRGLYSDLWQLDMVCSRVWHRVLKMDAL